MSIFNTKNYLAAVSGGPDSIALLNMYRRHIKVVCTVKYNKRFDCQKDVDCVKKLCDKYKIPLEILDVTKEIYDKYNDDNNFQIVARKIRYDFFCETAKKYNLKTLLVAHHLDDFLETAYIDFLKKSKKLFYGIKDKSNYKEYKIYRPFIQKYRKRTLQRYCNDLNLEYQIDSSNELDIYERNRTRKVIDSMSNDDVLSLIKKTRKYNKENKNKLIEINSKFNEWEKKGFNINFLKQNLDIEYYLVYEFLKLNSIYRPNQNKIEGIIEFINSNKGKQFRLESNFVLIKKNNILKIV